MKLPPLGKKERLQILAFALVLVIGALWAAVQFLIVPMARTRKDAMSTIKTREEDLKAGDKEIGKATGADEETKVIKAKLREIDEKYVLKPEYGNYMIRAQACADRIAAYCGISIDSMNMVGIQNIPQGSKEVSAFVVEVTARASYDAMVKLFDQIDAESPYFLISSPKISASQDPLLHVVTFKLYWPVWTNPKIVSNFAEKT